MDAAAEKVEEDFDIYQIIQTQKQMQFELDIVKAKLQIIGDPKFDELDVATIIDMKEPSNNGEKTPSEQPGNKEVQMTDPNFNKVNLEKESGQIAETR